MPGLRLALALALALAASGGQARAAPGGPAAAQIDGRPYQAALGALTNFQSCGVAMDAPEYRALAAALEAAEARGRQKGLGAELDRLRARYLAMLAVATSVPCVGGPSAARGRAPRGCGVSSLGRGAAGAVIRFVDRSAEAKLDRSGPRRYGRLARFRGG